MKWICYAVNNPVNKGTEEDPLWEDNLLPLKVPYSETALEIVKETAYNGKHTIDDDGLPEPVVEPTTDDILNAMLGVTE